MSAGALLALGLAGRVWGAEPLLVRQDPVELAPALVAWTQALAAQDLELAVDPAPLLAGDHPALPQQLVLPFRGLVVMGFSEAQLQGELTLTRTAPGQHQAALALTGPVVPRPRVQARLAERLQAEVDTRLIPTPLGPMPADPLLAQPEACKERIRAFAASPFPEAHQVLAGALEQVAPVCRRPLLAELLEDPAQRAPIVAWLAAGYHAAPEAERAGWCALMLQVPDLPPELESLLAAEEARRRPASAGPP